MEWTTFCYYNQIHTPNICNSMWFTWKFVTRSKVFLVDFKLSSYAKKKSAEKIHLLRVRAQRKKKTHMQWKHGQNTHIHTHIFLPHFFSVFLFVIFFKCVNCIIQIERPKHFFFSVTNYVQWSHRKGQKCCYSIDLSLFIQYVNYYFR